MYPVLNWIYLSQMFYRYVRMVFTNKLEFTQWLQASNIPISTVHRCVQLLCRKCVQTIVRGRRIIYIYVIDSVTYVLAQYSIAQQKSETTTLQLVALSSCQFTV